MSPVRLTVAERPPYGGAVVLVSHDQDFVRTFEPDRLLFKPEGTILVWDDGYLDLVALD